MEENIDNQLYSKPSYDGRLIYYDVIKEYMIGISTASLKGDFVTWFRLLNGIYALLNPYIKPENRNIIKTKFDETKKIVKSLQMNSIRENNNATLIQNLLDTKLQDIT